MQEASLPGQASCCGVRLDTDDGVRVGRYDEDPYDDPKSIDVDSQRV
jgi:hypothetical protein